MYFTHLRVQSENGYFNGNERWHKIYSFNWFDAFVLKHFNSLVLPTLTFLESHTWNGFWVKPIKVVWNHVVPKKMFNSVLYRNYYKYSNLFSYLKYDYVWGTFLLNYANSSFILLSSSNPIRFFIFINIFTIEIAERIIYEVVW